MTGAAERMRVASETSRSSSRRISSDSAETNSPQTLWRGNSPASSSATFAPWRAAVIAADVPAGPAPMIARSNSGCAAEMGIPSLFPDQHSHAKQKMAGDIEAHCGYLGQQGSHFTGGVGAAHGGWSVIPGDGAAKQRQPEIDQRQMQSISDQI